MYIWTLSTARIVRLFPNKINSSYIKSTKFDRQVVWSVNSPNFKVVAQFRTVTSYADFMVCYLFVYFQICIFCSISYVIECYLLSSSLDINKTSFIHRIFGVQCLICERGSIICCDWVVGLKLLNFPNFLHQREISSHYRLNLFLSIYQWWFELPCYLYSKWKYEKIIMASQHIVLKQFWTSHLARTFSPLAPTPK